MQHDEITRSIIAACYAVSNELGCGFLESVYHNALFIALEKRGLEVEREKCMTVLFQGTVVGQFFADLVANNRVIIELKAVSALNENHQAQLLNYLRASGYEVGLLVNFGNPKLDLRRFDNRFIKKETKQGNIV